MVVRFIAVAHAGAFLALQALTAVAAADQQRYQALPVDEATMYPELAALRDQLRDAVRYRDVEAVVALAEPDIHLSYGGDFGRDTLRELLQGVDDMPWTGEAYWQELETALSLGGAIWQYDQESGPVFCAPYTFFAELPADLDPFDAVLVIGDDAALRDGPGTQGTIVAHLDHDIAQIIDSGSGYDPENPTAPYWLLVRTADGAHEGYLSSDDVRSPLDYRACFYEDPETGAWSWDQFIAGD